MSSDSSQDSIQKQTQQALLSMVLTSKFRVMSESVGVPSLLGQKVRVIRQAGLNPTLPQTYCIEPVGINPKDEKFMNLFKGIKPSLREVKDGKIICTGGIVAELVMDIEDG